MTYWDDKAINPPKGYESLDHVDQGIRALAWLIANNEWEPFNDNILEILLKSLNTLEQLKIAWEKQI